MNNEDRIKRLERYVFSIMKKYLVLPLCEKCYNKPADINEMDKMKTTGTCFACDETDLSHIKKEESE
jgi:hypothetical protein